MLIYHQLLNGALLQKCLFKLNFCKLCLSEKLYIIKSLNDPKFLNKKSELVNTCRHQSKLLLKSFEKIDTVTEMIQWTDFLFLILVVMYLMC